MISTVCLLDRHTNLGPRAVSASLEYLGSRMQRGRVPPSSPTVGSVVTLDSEVAGHDQASIDPQEMPSLLPVASSPSDVLTATSIVLGSLAKTNDTGGLGLLFPENDDNDNGSNARKKGDDHFPMNFDYSAAAASLFRSVGENLMRWDRSPPDRHTTSMNLIKASEDWNWVQLFKIDQGQSKKPPKNQCPLRAHYLRNSLSILSGFA